MEERKSKRAKNKRVYRSVVEFEKGLLPASYKAKVDAQQEKEPGSFGAGLATEILERVRKHLAK